MISRLYSRMRKMRRFFSRGERAASLLRLPKSSAASARPGLILIQIDGLGRSQFSKALARRRLPFLRKLLRRSDYRLLTHYSGLPSTTPAVQGEILYGIPCAVPSFQFRDHQTGQMTWLMSTETASQIEADLEKRGDPLLKDGTAYSDIYSGGAAECSFCSSRLGWSHFWKHANLAALFAVVLMHFSVVVRMIFLGMVELGLALVDGAFGLIARQGFLTELIFIPKRVALCILMREMISLGVRMDVARGVPVIHCNFVGYDEQSHRRGPDSAFAHWTLKGIDASIRSIWRAAARSNARHYDVWIYSDHGQERAISYYDLHGRSINEPVTEVFERYGLPYILSPTPPDSIETERAALLGGTRLQRLLRWPTSRPKSSRVMVGGMGPIEHVYVAAPISPELRNELARELMQHTKAPFVAYRNPDGNVFLWSAQGKMKLPEDAAEMGWKGPLGREMAHDFIELTKHPDAGDFILVGWRKGGKIVTFADEHGSHGGIGPHETRGFALVPHDAPLQERPGGFIRPKDMHDAAMLFLGRTPSIGGMVRRAGLRTVRIMTYNVHSCIGMDGRHSPERIARVISRYEPDVVALQELDVNRLRTQGIDQAKRIAELLEMEYHFHPSFSVEEERYGNAILSVLPMKLVRAGALPIVKDYEPRGIIWVQIFRDGSSFNVFNTHLGLRPDERIRQVRALLDNEWVGGRNGVMPMVLCGDLNATPSSNVHRMLSAGLQDVQGGRRGRRPTWCKIACYDYIYASQEFQVHQTLVPRTHLTDVASDHVPVIADLVLLG